MSKEIILKATHGSDEKPLKIGDIEIPCYVLENGQRVLSRNGMLKALGLSRGGKRGNSGGDRLSVFVGSKALQPFISHDLMAVIETPIKFTHPTGGGTAHGYDAETLQAIVRAASKAFLTGKLGKQQENIGRNAEKLDDAFSKIGLIALIDEATGYQYDREKQELQKILKLYITEALLPWEKRFPDEFYREIFRLNGWDFTVSQIKSGARPGVIGLWTKKFIYAVLPKGVLHALLDKTPRNSGGKLTRKLHQHLTREQGIEHLNKQIVSVVTLMNISDNWSEFEKLWNKKFGQAYLEFKEESAQIAPPLPIPKLSTFNKNLKQALSFNPKKED